MLRAVIRARSSRAKIVFNKQVCVQTRAEPSRVVKLETSFIEFSTDSARITKRAQNCIQT